MQMRDDAEGAIATLNSLEPTDVRDKALLHVSLARASMFVRDFAAAQSHVDAAIATGVKGRDVAIIEPELLLAEQRLKMMADKPVERQALRAASAKLLRLADESNEFGRLPQAAVLRAWAIESLIVAGDREEALVLVNDDAATMEAEADTEGSVMLGEMALRLAAPERALALTEQSDRSDPRVLLLRGDALSNAKDAATMREGRALLEQLIDHSDEGIAHTACNSLLSSMAMAEHAVSSDWHETAATNLRANDPQREATLRGLYHSNRGEHEQAEQAWMEIPGKSMSLRLRAGQALDAGQKDKAVALGRQLHELSTDPSHSLFYAKILRRFDFAADALRICMDVARDKSAPREDRAHGFRMASQIAMDAHDPTQLQPVAEGWLTFDPTDDDAKWSLIYAHGLVGDFAEALCVAETGVEVSDPGRARLLSGMMIHGLPLDQAIIRIDAVSKQVGRSDEQVEFRIVGGGLMHAGALGPEAKRVFEEAFERFHKLFPGSNMLKAVPAPKDLDEFLAMLEEHGRSKEDAALLQQMLDRVMAGTAPVAAMAAIKGADTADVLSVLNPMPIAFPNAELLALETHDALEKYGMPAAFDATAVYVIASLDDDIRRHVLSALHGSYATTSTVQDARRFAPGITTDHQEVGTAGIAPNGEAFFVTTPPEVVEREREVARNVPQILDWLHVEGDTAVGAGDEASKAIDANPDAPPPVMALAAVFALASRRGLPIYSDDRVVRLMARQHGIASFGTVALLGILAEKSVLTRDQAANAITKLVSRVDVTDGTELNDDEISGPGKHPE